MIFHNIINKLLGDPVQITVLKLLWTHEEGLTGRSLATLTGCSTFKMKKVLETLLPHGLLTRTVIGRAYIYRLNMEHISIKKLIKPLIEFEKTLFLDLGKLIMKLLELKPLSVILYGSVARGEEDPNSDLDLLLIYDDSVPSHSIIDMGNILMEVIPKKYGNPVSVRRCLLSDFKKRIGTRDTLIRNIVKEGKVIAGLPLSELLESHG